MEPRNLAESLADTFLFRGMSPEDVASLLRGAEDRALADGEWIFREGDAARELLFLLTGEAEIRKRGKGEGERVLATLRAPTAFGEIAFLLHGIRNASARAKGEVTILSIGRDALQKTLEASPKAATGFLLNLARVLAARLHQADDAIVRLG